MSEITNVLHLSDLHFGIESDPSAPTSSARRKNTLDALIDELRLLDDSLRPHVIVITGDIGWRGLKKDYDQAGKWFQNLLDATGLTSNELVICAGNHDIDRNKTKGMNPPKSAQEADDWLQVENLENFLRPFSAFSDFCKECKMPELFIGDKPFPFIGYREICGLRFIVLNSAWFSRHQKEDKNNLWIGLPQLEVLAASKQLADDNRYDEDTVTLAVLHHPNSWLSDNEQNIYGDRRNSFNYLAEQSHIILVGHSHSRLQNPDRISNRAWLFKGGATYESSEYRNNVSILKINHGSRIAKRVSFEFDPGEGKWQNVIDNQPYDLRITTVNRVKEAIEIKYDIELLSEKIKDFTTRYIDRKSSAIGHYDTLPPLIRRKVSVHAREERLDRRNAKKLVLATAGNRAFFSEMISSERPTFLFGELGSGKSTLVGQYVLEIINQTGNILPLLLPASYFRGKEFKTVFDIGKSVSQYVNEQVYPSAKQDFDIIATLKIKTEVTLIVDGFDELDLDEASLLLNKLEEFTHQWARLRIIVTGRPVELVGLNYAGWQCLEINALTTEEQEQLFINEALAEGLKQSIAKEDAYRRLGFLQKNPELLSIATSPLTVRLIRPHLKEITQQKSVGDLLYDVILERLGKWSVKDLKQDYSDFKNAFPDNLSREKLLGKIAYKIYKSITKSITKPSLYSLLEEEIGNIQNKHSVVSQGCDFFIKNILSQEGENYTISAAPLLQCAFGIYIADLLANEDNNAATVDMTKVWREYSFAMAIIRRKGITPEIQPKIKKDLSFLKGERWLPIVAIIVAESADLNIAEYFVRSLNEYGFRPLKYLEEFRSMCFSSYAKSFFTAGEEGFKWFFTQYLDPVYPTPAMHNHDIYVTVFQHWLLLSDFHPTLKQIEKLSSIITPHMSTRSWQVHSLLPSVSLAIPEAFDETNRSLYFAQCLSSSLMRHKAQKMLHDEFNKGNKDHVLNALETVCEKDSSEHSGSAAKLWMDFSSEKPPLSVVHAVINATLNSENKELLDGLLSRLGNDSLTSVLRWYCLRGDKLSTAAALLLMDKENNENLYFIGPALLNGLHDGGKIDGAEQALHNLVKENGESGLVWLVNKFPYADSMHGAHSAYWRILLKELNGSDQTYPQLLTFAIRYLGEFILPRYPDIRRELYKLLTSKDVYKLALERELQSIDNVTRYNAACTLISCFPESETTAIGVVIAATKHSFERHEWTRFCMRLSLGEKVQTYILEKLDTFLPIPKTFALTLLHHNNCKLSSSQYGELIVGLLEETSFDYGAGMKGDDLPRILAEEKAYVFLADILKHNIKLAEKAANALLDHHRDKLDDEMIMECLTRVINSMQHWDLMRLDSECDAIIENPAHLKRISEYSFKIQTETNQEPILGIYLRTLLDDSAWQDLIWAAIFRDSFLSITEIEGSCLWLLSKGKKDINTGNSIGTYAKKILDDSRVLHSRQNNAAPFWLALLAHEFIGLSNEKIQKIILKYRPIHSEVVSALVARLGYVPKNYQPDERRSYLSVFSKNKRFSVEVPTTELVIDITRDAGEIHPDFPAYVEMVILSGAFTQEEILRLASKSKFANLFVVFILYCRDLLNDYNMLTHLIGIQVTGNNSEKNNTTRIVDSAINNILTATAGNESCRSQYIDAIKEKIIKGNHSNIISLFRELLDHKVPLNSELFAILMSELVSHPYNLDSQLTHFLSDFLVNGLQEEDKPSITLEIKKGVRSLAAGLNFHESIRDVLCSWFFSLSAIYLQNSIDKESKSLFLRGLRNIFIQKYEFHPTSYTDSSSARILLKDILNAVYPLFVKISPSIIRSVIQDGANSEMPETASVCKLLIALVKQ